MSALFQYSSDFFGLDIGTTAVRLVQLRGGGPAPPERDRVQRPDRAPRVANREPKRPKDVLPRRSRQKTAAANVTIP